jgi:hypothetical protein
MGSVPFSAWQLASAVLKDTAALASSTYMPLATTIWALVLATMQPPCAGWNWAGYRIGGAAGGGRQRMELSGAVGQAV